VKDIRKWFFASDSQENFNCQFLFSIYDLHRLTGNQRKTGNLPILEVKKVLFSPPNKNISKSFLLQSYPDALSKILLLFFLRFFLERVPLKKSYLQQNLKSKENILERILRRNLISKVQNLKSFLPV
jgi:hypothetical protein